MIRLLDDSSTPSASSFSCWSGGWFWMTATFSCPVALIVMMENDVTNQLSRQTLTPRWMRNNGYSCLSLYSYHYSLLEGGMVDAKSNGWEEQQEQGEQWSDEKNEKKGEPFTLLWRLLQWACTRMICITVYSISLLVLWVFQWFAMGTVCSQGQPYRYFSLLIMYVKTFCWFIPQAVQEPGCYELLPLSLLSSGEPWHIFSPRCSRQPHRRRRFQFI